ncbi:MAG: aromatic ring-hydroxylating dioxygenase subunit alpha [Verrucomicrobiales bacterium]|nr:aromatic ring-hydroxylating dioxygenase subunit alpha [Verrucomicrobiales bacterium]
MLDLSKTRPIRHTGDVFTSFPREYYLSAEWFEREMELIFSRQWLYAEHESEVRHTGDFITREVGDESILVTRDGADLHALFNVCRHRGAGVCQESHGNARRFVCPYHRWTYNLDGRLIAAPAMPDTFEPARYSLFRAHVRSWNGLLFINLSEDMPEPLDQMLESAKVGMAPLDVANCKVAHAITYSVAANWKLVLDNFMECYHCPGAHPEFCRTFDLKHIPAGALTASSHPLVDFGDLALKRGTKSLTMTGELVCRKLMGSLTMGDLPTGVGLTLRPTTSAAFFGDYGIVFDFQPVSLAETRVRCQWLVAGDAEHGRDYDVESLIAVWDITNRQDWPLCESTQKGVRSRHFVSGPNSLEQEPGVEVFRSSYLAMMGVSC